MTSIEAFSHLEANFERIVKSLDRAVLLDFIRRFDPPTFIRYFRGFRPQTLGWKRIVDALYKEVYERKNEAVGDILTMLWNQHHRDLYQAMLAHVKTISEDVESIERIEDELAVQFIEDLSGRFDKRDILACVRLNEVRFSEEVIQKYLEVDAQRETKEEEAKQEDQQPKKEEEDWLELSDDE